jgi:hypothetical protein
LGAVKGCHLAAFGSLWQPSKPQSLVFLAAFGRSRAVAIAFRAAAGYLSRSEME